MPSSPSQILDAAGEVDRLKRDRVRAFLEIERYKKIVTYALIFAIFSFVVAIVVVVWSLTEGEPTFEELREKVIRSGIPRLYLLITIFLVSDAFFRWRSAQQ